jgi:hypothetical protein
VDTGHTYDSIKPNYGGFAYRKEGAKIKHPGNISNL